MHGTDTTLKHSHRVQDGYRWGVRRIRQNGHPGAIVASYTTSQAACIDARKRRLLDKMRSYEVVDLTVPNPRPFC